MEFSDRPVSANVPSTRYLRVLASNGIHSICALCGEAAWSYIITLQQVRICIHLLQSLASSAFAFACALVEDTRAEIGQVFVGV